MGHVEFELDWSRVALWVGSIWIGLESSCIWVGVESVGQGPSCIFGLMSSRTGLESGCIVGVELDWTGVELHFWIGVALSRCIGLVSRWIELAQMRLSSRD